MQLVPFLRKGGRGTHAASEGMSELCEIPVALERHTALDRESRHFKNPTRAETPLRGFSAKGIGASATQGLHRFALLETVANRQASRPGCHHTVITMQRSVDDGRSRGTEANAFPNRSVRYALTGLHMFRVDIKSEAMPSPWVSCACSPPSGGRDLSRATSACEAASSLQRCSWIFGFGVHRITGLEDVGGSLGCPGS